MKNKATICILMIFAVFVSCTRKEMTPEQALAASREIIKSREDWSGENIIFNVSKKDSEWHIYLHRLAKDGPLKGLIEPGTQRHITLNKQGHIISYQAW
jgi:hypothetical protein